MQDASNDTCWTESYTDMDVTVSKAVRYGSKAFHYYPVQTAAGGDITYFPLRTLAYPSPKNLPQEFRQLSGSEQRLALTLYRTSAYDIYLSQKLLLRQWLENLELWRCR